MVMDALVYDRCICSRRCNVPDQCALTFNPLYKIDKSLIASRNLFQRNVFKPSLSNLDRNIVCFNHNCFIVRNLIYHHLDSWCIIFVSKMTKRTVFEMFHCNKLLEAINDLSIHVINIIHILILVVFNTWQFIKSNGVRPTECLFLFMFEISSNCYKIFCIYFVACYRPFINRYLYVAKEMFEPVYTDCIVVSIFQVHWIVKELKRGKFSF